MIGGLRLKENSQKENGVSTYHMVFMLNTFIQMESDELS